MQTAKEGKQTLMEVFADLVDHWLLHGYAYRLDDGQLVIDKATADQLLPIIEEFGHAPYEKK
ncbi:MAG: hypothetical protein ACO33E_06435 [Aquiluna sp.]